MSEKESHCTECGADYTANQECQCGVVAAEMDPARELDAIEVLISVAKKAMKIIDAANEEEEGPMAMPTPIAEDLREAIYNLEDIMSLLPYETIVKLRMEMVAAEFNAKVMRQDGIEDLPAYAEHLKEELEKEAEVAAMNLGEDAVYGSLIPRQEDGIEIDPMDDDGNIGAANPDMLKKFTAKSQEDLATKSLEFLLKHGGPIEAGQGGPIEAGQRVGLTIREVIDRYKPDIQVKCPHTEECISVEADGFRTCPHSDFHRVEEGCFFSCILHEGSTGCKPMEDFSDEEAIE